MSLTSKTQLYFRLDASVAFLTAAADRLEQLGDYTLTGAMRRQLTLLQETLVELAPEVNKEQRGER